MNTGEIIKIVKKDFCKVDICKDCLVEFRFYNPDSDYADETDARRCPGCKKIKHEGAQYLTVKKTTTIKYLKLNE